MRDPRSADPVVRHPFGGIYARVPLRWRTLLAQWGLVVAVAAAGLVTFAELGDDIARGEPFAADEAIRNAVLARRSAAVHAVFLAITHAGAPAPLIALVGVCAAWLWAARGRRVAALLTIAPLLALATFLVVKRIVQRPRPEGALLLGELAFSFPSGHATTAAAVLGSLAWVVGRERLLPLRLTLPLAVVLALLIGASRVVLDVHWATDVLAGWGAGLAVAALTIGAYERLRRRARVVEPPAGGRAGA